MPEVLSFEPIGVVHSPFRERVEAPRQPAAASEVEGEIELWPGRNFEHALCDIEGWTHLWVVFVFHLNDGWRPKVLPPRSDGRRRGVFATRSPHRPNPIGLSVVRLLGVEGLRLRVRGVDMVDGTPVLDLKPYVHYTDSISEASGGWLGKEVDPAPTYEVCWSEQASEQLTFLRERGVDLRDALAQALGLGPQPNPYRRIRIEADGSRTLAHKEWRVKFEAAGRQITVLRLRSGYKAAQLGVPERAVHRDFVERFG